MAPTTVAPRIAASGTSASELVAASPSAVSIEEYLRTEYRPDVEYIDGFLKKKPLVGMPHGEVQVILGDWFRRHRKEWGMRVAVETRTRVTKERVRLPDLVVVSNQERAQSELNAAPLIAIEVLSLTDTYVELRNRASDLRAMGTENVWLVDPELRTAEVWNSQTWQPVGGNILQAVNSPMHIDLAWLWAELDS